mgnify:CR=1 FL=1
MSVDKFAFLGAYLKVGKVKVKHLTSEIGCANCKTVNTRDRFCSKCGGQHLDYSKEVTAKSFSDLLDLSYEREEISAEEHDDILDSCLFEDDVIQPRGNSEIGIEHEVDYDFHEMTMPVVDTAVAQEFFKPITNLLDKYEVSYELKIGIVFYCR